MVIKRSHKYIYRGIILLTIAFLAGIYLLYQGNIIGGIIVPFGTLISILMLLKGLRDSTPRVTIDSEGISATEFMGVKILWPDIEKVRIIRRTRIGRILIFNVKNEERYQTQFLKATGEKFKSPKIENSSFYIMVEGLNIAPQILQTEINKRLTSVNDSQFVVSQ